MNLDHTIRDKKNLTHVFPVSDWFKCRVDTCLSDRGIWQTLLALLVETSPGDVHPIDSTTAKPTVVLRAEKGAHLQAIGRSRAVEQQKLMPSLVKAGGLSLLK